MQSSTEVVRSGENLSIWLYRTRPLRATITWRVRNIGEVVVPSTCASVNRFPFSTARSTTTLSAGTLLSEGERSGFLIPRAVQNTCSKATPLSPTQLSAQRHEVLVVEGALFT